MPPRTRNRQQTSSSRRRDEDYVDLDDSAVERLLEEEKSSDEDIRVKSASKDEEEDEEMKERKKRIEEDSLYQNDDDIFKKEIETILARRETDGLYLVKFKELSHLHADWVPESAFQDSQQNRLKLNRFIQKQQKKEAEQIVDDSKGEKDEGDKGEEESGEEELFDRNFSKVDKVLSCTNLFTVIHPRQAKGVLDTWRERCIPILQILSNHRLSKVNIGVPFLFSRSEDKNSIDFATINNRLFTVNQSRLYEVPFDFWKDLGSVLAEGLHRHKPRTKQRIMCERLRQVALMLYKTWHAHVQDCLKRKEKDDR